MVLVCARKLYKLYSISLVYVNKISFSDPDSMLQAVDVLKDIVCSHDLDTRYEATDTRARIANLYMPLLAIVSEVLPQLYGYDSDKDDTISESLAMAIAMSSISQRPSVGDMGRAESMQSQVIKGEGPSFGDIEIESFRSQL